MSEGPEIRLWGDNYLSAGTPQGSLQGGWLGGKKSPRVPGHGFKSQGSHLGFPFPCHSPNQLPPPFGHLESHHSGQRGGMSHNDHYHHYPQISKTISLTTSCPSQVPPPNSVRWLQGHSSSSHTSDRQLSHRPDVKKVFLRLNQRLFSCSFPPFVPAQPFPHPHRPHPSLLALVTFAQLWLGNPEPPPHPRHTCPDPGCHCSGPCAVRLHDHHTLVTRHLWADCQRWGWGQDPAGRKQFFR